MKLYPGSQKARGREWMQLSDSGANSPGTQSQSQSCSLCWRYPWSWRHRSRWWSRSQRRRRSQWWARSWGWVQWSPEPLQLGRGGTEVLLGRGGRASSCAVGWSSWLLHGVQGLLIVPSGDFPRASLWGKRKPPGSTWQPWEGQDTQEPESPPHLVSEPSSVSCPLDLGISFQILIQMCFFKPNISFPTCYFLERGGIKVVFVDKTKLEGPRKERQPSVLCQKPLQGPISLNAALQRQAGNSVGNCDCPQGVIPSSAATARVLWTLLCSVCFWTKFSQQPTLREGPAMFCSLETQLGLCTWSTHHCGSMQEKEPQEEAAPDPAVTLSRGLCLSSVVPDPPVSWPGGQGLSAYSSWNWETGMVFRLHLYLSNISHISVSSAFLPAEKGVGLNIKN